MAIPIAFNGYSDGITIVNFWAPWCPSCRDELPDLEKVWEENNTKGVKLIGVTYESDVDSINTAIDLYGLTYPIATDPGAEVSSIFHVTGVPETYIVDTNGKIVFVEIGATNYEKLSQEVMTLTGQVQEEG